MNDLIRSLTHIGTIQFGRFETRSGVFAPGVFHFSLLPSYPAILQALAEELAPLVHIDGLTHLLTTPAATPIGVAVSLAARIPLVYPAPGNIQVIEGAYDFNVPTVLLTDVFGGGEPERAASSLITRVRPLGLDVKALVTVLDIGASGASSGDLPLVVWHSLRDILPEIPNLTPSMRAAVVDWLADPNR